MYFGNAVAIPTVTVRIVLEKIFIRTVTVGIGEKKSLVAPSRF
jgi:hypothetical protein